MQEIDKFETKIKNIRELIIDTIEHDYNKLINNLNIEKRLEIERIKKIEIKLEKIKLSKIIAVRSIKYQLEVSIPVAFFKSAFVA